ncbi:MULTISPECIES: hypothetical protein [Luteimonas]|uniref:hypothetical protein n=1 Tax=Luteimonas TaxID=83614 RepID=UPI000C7B8E93|nr:MULTISPECIES: hypothetical protein [Luteimonas]
MRTTRHPALLSLAVVLALSACAQAPDTEAPAGSADAAPRDTAVTRDTWPASLPAFGDGYPDAGDPCRRVGESAATIDYLDDSAVLVGCPSAADVAPLGGRTVATIDGVTLVSVPGRDAVPGDGDGQGDATVPGTPFHATAQIRCSGYRGAAEGLCPAGVVRNAETGASIEVTLPDGAMRMLYFNPDGSFLSFGSAQADGTAAMESSAQRDGNTTIATLGSERYAIPDAFVTGD